MELRGVISVLKAKAIVLLCAVLISVMSVGFMVHKMGTNWLSTIQLVNQTNSIITPPAQSDGSEPDSSSPSAGAARDQATVFSSIVKSSAVIGPAVLEAGYAGSIKNLLTNISVASPTAHLFQIAVTDKDPQMSAKLANSIADHIREEIRRRNSQDESNRLNVLIAQLKSTDAKLKDARLRLDRYRSKNLISVTVGNNVEIALSRLKLNQTHRDEAAESLAQARAHLDAVLQQKLLGPQRSPKHVDLQLDQMKNELALADKHIAELRLRYTEAWPAVRTAIKERNELKSRLDIVASRQPELDADSSRAETPEMRRTETIDRLKQEIAGYSAELVVIDSSILAAQAEFDRLKGLDTQVNKLTTDVTDLSLQRTNLITNLERSKGLHSTAEHQEQVFVVEHVGQFNPPVNSSPGRVLKLALIAAVASFVLSSLILLSLDRFDRRIRSINQAEAELPGPVVAAIPVPTSPMNMRDLARVTQVEPQSDIAEAFRFLAMRILNCPSEIQSIGFLSAREHQGNTTSLTNLAITLAQTGKRVILVDANVRSAAIASVFDSTEPRGFTDLMLEPTLQLIDITLQPTEVPNLLFIGSGRPSDNPWSLFTSGSLEKVALLLRQRADYVLWDVASALSYTDGLNLAPVLDVAFSVFKFGEQGNNGDGRMAQMLRDANLLTAGTVLTKVPKQQVVAFMRNPGGSILPSNLITKPAADVIVSRSAETV